MVANLCALLPSPRNSWELISSTIRKKRKPWMSSSHATCFRFYGFSKPEKARNFELDFAKFIGTKYGLAVTSGTAALHVALNALGVGPGDEVILPAWAWYSCYNAILMTGALPVFAETNESFTLDPEELEKKITPKTKAVMPVHVFGSPVDMDKILPIAREHNLKVLETPRSLWMPVQRQAHRFDG
jgi:dTDP-4-amino-4,6-dideoxygalactose transaminase